MKEKTFNRCSCEELIEERNRRGGMNEIEKISARQESEVTNNWIPYTFEEL